MSRREREWIPDGAQWEHRLSVPGELIGLLYQAWRVIEINTVDAQSWTDRDRERVRGYSESWVAEHPPRILVVRPAPITSTDVRARDHDKHFRLPAGWFPRFAFYRSAEHYPVCVKCGDPTPCREYVAERDSARAAKDMERYEIEGVCPACRKPITARQKVRRFEENLYVPLGPPVTFHASQGDCHVAAMAYEDRWIEADPERVAWYRCTGMMTTHGPDFYECSNETCPGPQARHRALSSCSCDEHPRGITRPRPDAVRWTSEKAS